MSKIKFLIASFAMMLMVMCPKTAWAQGDSFQSSYRMGWLQASSENKYVKLWGTVERQDYAGVSVAPTDLYFWCQTNEDDYVLRDIDPFSGLFYNSPLDLLSVTLPENYRSCCYLDEKSVAIIPVTKIGDKYYGTFFSPVALQIYDGAMAYYPHVDENGDIILDEDHRSNIINAGQGVIIIADSDCQYVGSENGFGDKTGDKTALYVGSYEDEPVTFDSPSILTGTVEPIANPGNTLVLGTKNGNLGFYSYSGETLKGLRAYIDNSKGTISNNARIRFVSSMDNDESTAINQLFGAEETEAPSYSLTGQRVAADYKGIVIKNGKKVLVK